MLKQIALAATGLVVIGIGGFALTSSLGHPSLESTIHSIVDATANRTDATGATTNFDQSKSVDGQSVQSIQVTADAASIHVYPGSSSQIEAHAYGTLIGVNPSDFTFDVKKTGNHVIVSLKKQHLISFGFNSIRLRVDVQVPAHLYEALNAEASAGKVTVENLDAKSFNFRSSAGSIDASHLQGSVSADSSAGSVTLTDIKGDIDMESSAGSVNATNVDGSIRAHSSAGSIEIHLPDITHNITATSSAGSIRITTAHAPTGLSFNLQATAGGVHFKLPGAEFTVNKHSDIEGSIGNNGPMIDAEATAGSIDVEQAPAS